MGPYSKLQVKCVDFHYYTHMYAICFSLKLLVHFEEWPKTSLHFHMYMFVNPHVCPSYALKDSVAFNIFGFAANYFNVTSGRGNPNNGFVCCCLYWVLKAIWKILRNSRI